MAVARRARGSAASVVASRMHVPHMPLTTGLSEAAAASHDSFVATSRPVASRTATSPDTEASTARLKSEFSSARRRASNRARASASSCASSRPPWICSSDQPWRSLRAISVSTPKTTCGPRSGRARMPDAAIDAAGARAGRRVGRKGTHGPGGHRAAPHIERSVAVLGRDEKARHAEASSDRLQALETDRTAARLRGSRGRALRSTGPETAGRAPSRPSRRGGVVGGYRGRA